MKIKYTLILLILFFLVSCSSSKYFEGTITYRFESNLYDENNEVNLNYSEYSKREFGQYFVEYHKRGNYFRDYKGEDSIGLDFQLYIKKKNIKYTKYNYNDTLYWENTTNLNGANNFKVLVKTRNDTLINNEKLNLLLTEYELPYKGKVFKMNEEYYYNEKLKINPNDYINYKKYFLYETFKKMESLPFLYIKKSASKSLSETLIEITQFIDKKEKKIDLKSILNRIKNKPLKEK
ncbi:MULTISPECIES: hypothetical protein [Flavobacterium]|uniref:Lipoprotein n=1 Tax=Flavobacterium jumunjinense TaxID=998845 RepID=A0ABV5GK35_9FLAO|nr:MULTISPECIES: hypothetical protein [Flavobacterium]